MPFGFTPTANPAHAESFVGYPELAAAALHLAVTNASCPGETSASFISPAAGFSLCRAFRALAPLHVRYAGTQLEFATRFLRTRPATALVTITLGANDLLRCADGDTAECATSGRINRVLADYTTHLRTILAALRAATTARLVAVTYYSTDYRDAAQVAAVQALNARTRQAVEAYGGVLADGFAAFRAAAAADSGDACAAHLLARTRAGRCDIHPSVTGSRVLAVAVERVAGAVRAPRAG